jgi:hypothetical protein
MDLFSKAATTVGKSVAKNVAVKAAVKAQEGVVYASKKIKQKKGMMTEDEFFSLVTDNRVMIIEDRFVDTRSIYDSYSSSFDVKYKSDSKRCTVKAKKKLGEIQYQVRTKTITDGKTKKVDIGIIGKDNGVTERVTISIFGNHFNDVWKEKEKSRTVFSCLNPEWIISEKDNPYQFSIMFNSNELATITKVMTEANGVYRYYKHLLQIYDYQYELPCLFLFIAIAILDNTSILNEPSRNKTVFDAITK